MKDYPGLCHVWVMYVAFSTQRFPPHCFCVSDKILYLRPGNTRTSPSGGSGSDKPRRAGQRGRSAHGASEVNLFSHVGTRDESVRKQELERQKEREDTSKHVNSRPKHTVQHVLLK